MREKKNSQRDYPKLFIFEITTGYGAKRLRANRTSGETTYFRTVYKVLQKWPNETRNEAKDTEQKQCRLP